MNKSLAPVAGSALDVAQQTGKTLAHIFALADIVVLCDVSGSMTMSDSREGKTRYAVLLEELEALQKQERGRIIVLGFSDTAQWIPTGTPPLLASTTNLSYALEYAKMADVVGRAFFLISDGEPDSPEKALGVATTYKCKINTIFVGPERSTHGQECLRQISAASGGKHGTADRVMELATTVAKQLPARTA